jgi:quercetin dioxygenase-like cupin family protein
MAFEFRRVVTVLGDDGKSQIHEDAPLPHYDVPVLPGAQMLKLWGSETAPAPGVAAPADVNDPFFPGPDGNRWQVTIFPPAPAPTDAPPAAPSDAELEAMAAETERVFPGLADKFEPDAPGFHTSDTIDYVLVLEGELFLKLDDGVEVRLTPGSCVVQNGTRHAWENRAAERAIVVAVILGGQRVR